MELSSYVDANRAIALNQDESHPVANLFITGPQYELRSDADDQLVIVFPFKEKVKIQGIRCITPQNDTRPVRIKLFINNSNLDFSDCEARNGDFEATLADTDTTTDSKPLALRVAKFTSVDTITLFIENSTGGEISAISKVEFFGQVMMGTNMNELKKVG
mmetsp:Transcript_14054/g.18390  ORF Transcript_14054/g.18390 Transcript_14054/m.18390 type:complete len:160 (+) Transcript_14054:55-534(+)